MRKFLLTGALCATTLGFVGAPVRAQDQEEPFALAVQAKSGIELFAEARALIKDGPNGEPLASETLAPAENLRLQRLGAARNAPALAKLREALQAYIILPAFDAATPDGGLTHLESTGAARQFARHLWQEAAVRAADGDALGAAQSNLDALELASQAARGPIINALVGASTSAIARKSLLKNADGLNAAQLREVAAQWEKTSGTFPTYPQTLRDEEQIQLRLLHANLVGAIVKWSDPVAIAQMEAEFKEERDNDELDEEEIKQFNENLRQLKGVTFADVIAEKRAIFDEALVRANQPYLIAQMQEPLKASNAWLALSAQFLNETGNRFYADRDVVNNRALVAALRLRATKLESGQYPATFDAQSDPFSPDLAPLIYKRAGDSYVLYSVGPDGIDNDGAEIQTVTTDRETGAKSVSDRLAPDSTGDIIAPVL